MRERSDSIFYNVDWLTVGIYVILVTMGWFNIYSAVYDEAKSDIFNMDRQESKQLVFVFVSLALAFSILIIDASFFTATAFILYGGVLLLNLLVLVAGTSIRGSHSWFRIGSFGFQPAEFAKWATGLALAKYLSSISRPSMRQMLAVTLGIIATPVFIIIVLQNETGVALVFAAFIFVLYREGIVPGWILLMGLLTVVAFVLGSKYPGTLVDAELLRDKKYPIIHGFTFDWVNIAIFAGVVAVAGGIRLLVIRRTFRQLFITIIAVSYFSGIYVVSPLALNKMPTYQGGRIKVWLGMEVPRWISDRYDYNTRQSMIAIGSGGWFGKGYLQGTQTKFRFVPEQETDFIFCTVGEEWGFVGTSVVIVLYLILVMRLIILSERQRSDFTRIYGYAVAAVFFIHLVVNAGMTIGLIPVIGIPLPFFSYGGSSLISFTILLFIFVKLDSQRLLILR